MFPTANVTSKRDTATSEGNAKLEKERKQIEIVMETEEFANKNNLKKIATYNKTTLASGCSFKGKERKKMLVLHQRCAFILSVFVCVTACCPAFSE